jgi:hypothetical protein
MKNLLLVAAAVLVTAAVAVPLARRAVPPAPALAPVATIQEIMEGIVVPTSTAIFESVGTISTAAGTVDKAPSTPQDWEALERHAYLLVEAAGLLGIHPRRVERPSVEPEPGGESSPEVPPAEIEARIMKDPAAWQRHLDELRVVALRAQKAAHDRSVDGLFEVGGDMDLVCERCHQAYWYNAPEGVKIRR